MSPSTLKLRVNGEPCECAAMTLAGLLEARGVRRARGVAIAVSGRVVPASAWADRQLSDGDDIEIIKAIGGG